MNWKLGVIGGSGLYDIDGMKGEWTKISTPFGEPSDEVFCGTLEDQEVVFLPRHGRGHKFSPSDINYRANIYALKALGVTDVVSVSAVGSLKHRYAPGDFVVINQFIDKTYARETSFFGSGLVAHVSMATPVCERLSELLYNSARQTDVTIHKGGTYLVIEGPQFSTRSESELYRNWNCDVIGMTNMPEAKLAREAELPYATVAMITDYDCWNDEHDHVDVSMVVRIAENNAKNAKLMIKNLCRNLSLCERTPSPCDTALDNAIITAPYAQNIDTVKKLEIILKRVIGKAK